MTPEQFTYWLQGVVETIDGKPSERQWLVICDHLATVFNKQTPERQSDDAKTGDPAVDEQVKKLVKDLQGKQVRGPVRYC
jgi:hypothetical protein